MRAFIAGLFLFTFFSYSLAAGTCTLTATVNARSGGSWTTNGISYQIYDMTITNTGSCPITSAFVLFNIPAGSTIAEWWNYDPTTGFVSDYGTLAPAASYTGAGIVVTNGGVPTVQSTSSSVCSASCTGSTPPPTNAPTSPPTNGPTSGPIDSHCQLSVTQTRRSGAGSTWVTGSNTYQIYDLVFTNTGTENMLAAVFSEGLPVGYPSSFWQLAKYCCTQVDSTIEYNITLPNGGLIVGNSVGAGYILQYASSASLMDPEFTSPIMQTQSFKWVTCQQ